MEILYQDDHLVAVHKPAGMFVHRTELAPDREVVVQRLRAELGRRVHPVHRLDRATSGVLVLALHARAAARLAEAFRGRSVEKAYLAVVRGHPEPPEGCLDRPLRKRPGRPGPQREALTWYHRLAEAELPVPVGPYPRARYALLAAWPLTGRQHQIRRHLKHASHPLIGDTTHGDGEHNRLFRERFGSHRLLLAAVRIAFAHPASGAPMTVTAPPAPEMAEVIAALGWRTPDPRALRPPPGARAALRPPADAG